MALSKKSRAMETVYLFAAFPAEAKPFIKHFKLKKELSINAFAIYRHAQVTLTLTGLGKPAMAAGLAYTLARFPADNGQAILLNIGIAGHWQHPLGSLFCAEKIIDQETQAVYYPQLVATPPCVSQPLTTVGRPELEYKENTLYDMEAAAFYATAIRFSSSELIQCIKVVSDNKANPAHQIKPAHVSELMQAAVPVVTEYIERLSALSALTQAPHIAFYAEIVAQTHFTQQQQQQLKALLDQRRLLIADELDITALYQYSAPEILKALQQELNKHTFGGFA